MKLSAPGPVTDRPPQVVRVRWISTEVAIVISLFATTLFSVGNSCVFRQMYYDDANAACAGDSHYLEVKPYRFSHLRCCAICLRDPNCKFVIPKVRQCQLFNMEVPSHSNCSHQVTVAYTKMIDFAVNRPVTFSSESGGHEGTFAKVTNEEVSWSSPFQCPCTLNKANNHVTIDLGESRKFTTIAVTLSLNDRQNFFKQVKVHIGNTGGTSDPHVTTVNYSANRSPLQIIKIPVEAEGRYVTLFQSQYSHFCMCKIQVIAMNLDCK